MTTFTTASEFLSVIDNLSDKTKALFLSTGKESKATTWANLINKAGQQYGEMALVKLFWGSTLINGETPSNCMTFKQLFKLINQSNYQLEVNYKNIDKF